MAPERKPMEESRPLPEEGIRHALANQHRAQRRVGGSDALRRGDQIRLDPEVGRAKEFTEPPEAADHLVHNHQDPRPVAERPDPLKVLRRAGGNAPAGVLDRLGDDRRHLLRPLELNQSLDLVVAGEGAGRRVAAVGAPLPNE